MYHGSYEGGKAYQEELLRVAGVKNVEEFEGTIQSHRSERFLSRVFSRLFREKREIQPAPQIYVHRPGAAHR